MIFELTPSGSLSRAHATWNPKELEIEDYILPTTASDEPILDAAIFGERLLVISRQVRTAHKKRADILALDRAGNGVIVELKRDRGALGVETQALQYLADFSAYRGSEFVRRFARQNKDLEETIPGFLGDDVDLEDINKKSRIILVARRFDPSLFSMAEWLAQSGVPVRCIAYEPFDAGDRQFLSFSIAFDRSSEALYPLIFSQRAREPRIFWHNVGHPDDGWWRYLVKVGQISASFSNEPGDQGEYLLRSYISGDRVVAYAKGYGAVGWGIIRRPESYRLVAQGSKDDRNEGFHRHRIAVEWKSVASSLKEGLSPAAIRDRFGIHHPVSTSVSIKPEKGEALIIELDRQFPLPTSMA